MRRWAAEDEATRWGFTAAAPEMVAFVTKHGKERLVEPLLAARGLRLEHLGAIDTDVLGTFTRERARPGTALDAARIKLEWGFTHAPHARFALASEGSFGPHPQLPWIAAGHELVLLKDAATGLELRGDDLTTDTNFGAEQVSSVEEARAFAARHDFPSHALIVGPHKGVTSEAQLDRLVAEALAVQPSVHVETDMRAHLNPLRQASIRRALVACLAALDARCASCGWPGFVVSERVPGLPCEDCGAPTALARELISRCQRCRHEVLERVGATAPAGRCDTCNP